MRTVIQRLLTGLSVLLLALVAPRASTSLAASICDTYTVGAGDSLSAIAYRYGVSIDALVTENALSDPNVLAIGQAIRIPCSSAHAQPAQLQPTTGTTNAPPAPSAPLNLRVPAGAYAPDAAGNLSPFTGLNVDASQLNRRPLLVKVENDPNARPQAGLDRADVVVEHIAEGGETRFTGVYHSQGASLIGPVRSARLIDLELPLIFRGSLVFSGASGPVLQRMVNSAVGTTTIRNCCDTFPFYRIPGRVAFEHTLFTDTGSLWRVAANSGWATRPAPLGWVFSTNAPARGKSASYAAVPYQISPARWSYDPASGHYYRWMAGYPHQDRVTGYQLSADNVILVYVNYVDSLIQEDILGSHGWQVQLWGGNRVAVLRDGKGVEGNWYRAGGTDPLRFVDTAGNLIPLKPGKTWIELIPLWMEASWG